ncbi:hypothetical protein MMH89_04685 [Candidatus Comchoanobacter bicostacola]|uniref:Uncharacterized protein n=1 Tax=Candidatus Comchoanobacter bicostacola TaxID=2919598 RepID=A0ABY5DLI8_9GAMM|nr:hypothetical protein [Candidatus Comchoanobacter bicostacola]UTC24514.1 hypothetical protein MMH89_04685 [Candidatus Comchoanobacter bicostacola]
MDRTTAVSISILLTSMTFQATHAKQITPITIANETQCTLTLVALNEQSAKLNIPNVIPEDSEDSNNSIVFNTGWFSNNAQSAYAEYSITCGENISSASIRFAIDDQKSGVSQHYMLIESASPHVIFFPSKMIPISANPVKITVVPKTKNNVETTAPDVQSSQATAAENKPSDNTHNHIQEAQQT